MFLFREKKTLQKQKPWLGIILAFSICLRIYLSLNILFIKCYIMLIKKYAFDFLENSNTDAIFETYLLPTIFLQVVYIFIKK